MFRHALDLAPQRIAIHSQLALTLLAQGRGEEALAEAPREPVEAWRLWALAIVHHALGHRAESDAALRELIEKHGETMAFQVAEVHGERGETDMAFEWLDQAFAQRDPGVTEAKMSPHLRALHGDPRWGPFMKKLGFED